MNFLTFIIFVINIIYIYAVNVSVKKVSAFSFAINLLQNLADCS